MEPILMVFDEAFHPAPGTKDALIDEGGPASFKVGYHIARVRTTWGDFCFENDPSWAPPAFRLIGKRVEQSNRSLPFFGQPLGLL